MAVLVIVIMMVAWVSCGFKVSLLGRSGGWFSSAWGLGFMCFAFWEEAVECDG